MVIFNSFSSVLKVEMHFDGHERAAIVTNLPIDRPSSLARNTSKRQIPQTPD